MRQIFSKAKKIFLSAIISAGIFFGGTVADAETTQNFEDAEYFGSDGLDIINAAAAYKKGFTGKGVTIGVLDQPINFLHPKFSAKTASMSIRDAKMKDGVSGVYDWKNIFHGTHVAAIVAGSRNGQVMHGVAFDANILGASFMDNYSGEFGKDGSINDDNFAPYLNRAEVKVINNSWNADTYLDEFFYDDYIKQALIDNGEDWHKLMDDLEGEIVKKSDEIKNTLADIARAVDAKRLTIFSAGNGGHSSPALNAQLNWFNDNAEFYLLGVSNIYNRFGKNKSGLVRNSDGSISGDWLLYYASDAVKYLEDASVGAPGREILSAYSDFAASGENYIRATGTSMSAPHVTGVAALVQQAFPYMDGKQIADVILSTANKNINLTKNYHVALRTDIDTDADGNKNKKVFVSVYYFDDKDRTEDEVVTDLNRFADTMIFSSDKKENADSKKTFKEIVKLAQEQSALKVYFQTPLQSLIGQGIVDAGKAVNGPGALNARRLTSSDITTQFGDKVALYTIDTKGFDSTWSNDINEIREGKLAPENTEPDLVERYNYYHVNWLSKDLSDYNQAYWSDILTEKYIHAFNSEVDKDGLEGLHVGLKKIGDGRLTLTGDNTYEGATVVEQGMLTIDGKIFGDAYTSGSGTISGRGTIHGTLNNFSAAEAGDSSGVGDLTVGNLNSSGKLIVNVSGAGNTKFVVNGSANLDGTIFVVKGEKLSGKEIVALTANSITGNVKTSDASCRAEVRGNSVVLVFK
ncbi:MAG: S8 family serine peptidase [Selenomonadaceae bacterium]|nr:S8 family serine peptidase [Selenomonadaceae bacterium]